jgi:hypothetical protein
MTQLFVSQGISEERRKLAAQNLATPLFKNFMCEAFCISKCLKGNLTKRNGNILMGLTQ